MSMSNVDVELLNRYRATAFDTDSTCFTNWLGLLTDASIFGGRSDLAGKVFSDIPTVSDDVYGGYLEYAALLTAIDNSIGRGKFTAVELGAGWGPWISAAGKVCKRLGVADINLTGVEADREKCRFMREHMLRNEVTAKIILGAAWTADTTIRFPKIHYHDHGGAVSATSLDGAVDYRGFPQEYIDVPAYSIQTICEGMDIVDYMHWDIQGAEYDVLCSSADFLDQHVRYLFIGTHSRPIEGKLIKYFFENKWDILAQTPCNFIYDKTKPTIEGMTQTDGEIFVRNPRFVPD